MWAALGMSTVPENKGRLPAGTVRPTREHGGSDAVASFSDPDGNGWLLQEITTRLPGR